MLQHFFNFLGCTPAEMSTVLFAVFVVFQLFNAFNSRELTDKSIIGSRGNNKLMLLVFAATFALQIVIIQFCGAFFDTVPLSFSMWIKIFAVGISVVLLSEITKLISRARRKSKA